MTELVVILTTVLDVLRLKHPDPCIPAQLRFFIVVLPQFEDVEITSCHVLLSARSRVVHPGGCDAWHGKMFCCDMVLIAGMLLLLSLAGWQTL